MANDKDFILKNAVEVGGPTNVTLGTVTSDNLDLSTGNYFKDTPSGDSTYSISNAGDVQSFQLEVTGGLAAVAQNFSTDIWTGDNSVETITNGIDLANDGGLTWFKVRNASQSSVLIDSVRGLNKTLFSNETRTQATLSSNITYNSNGMTLPATAVDPSIGIVNANTYSMVAWTFKKATKFFDIVTYTGNGSARNISHNLGSTPGMIITKAYSSGASYPQWYIHHRSLGFGQNLEFTTSAAGSSSIFTASNSTTFSIGSSERVNENGKSFVAYLFAHETAADSQIKCGSYTGNGSNTGNFEDLGWQPQWIMVKVSSATDGWILLDSVRGVTGGNDPRLEANTSGAEANGQIMDFSSTGFTPLTADGKINGSGKTYIYVAIRAASDPDITWPSSIEWPGGVAPSAPAVGETDLFTFSTDDGGTSYVGVKTADNLS